MGTFSCPKFQQLQSNNPSWHQEDNSSMDNITSNFPTSKEEFCKVFPVVLTENLLVALTQESELEDCISPQSWNNTENIHLLALLSWFVSGWSFLLSFFESLNHILSSQVLKDSARLCEILCSIIRLFIIIIIIICIS